MRCDAMRIILSVCVVAIFSIVFCCEHYRSHPFVVNRHLAALILARGGSKGIQLKNIAPIGNTTLLNNSIQKLKKIGGFSSIWVSTDHQRIYEAAVTENVNVHWRSPDYATDSSSSISATQEWMQFHPEIHKIALIQCTSPFLQISFLTEALSKINSYECVFSVTRSHKLQWKVESEKLVAVNFDPFSRPRRQDRDDYYIENGMFYFANRKLIERGSFQSNNCAFVHVPPEYALEIDTEYDLKLANLLWNNF